MPLRRGSHRLSVPQSGECSPSIHKQFRSEQVRILLEKEQTLRSDSSATEIRPASMPRILQFISALSKIS